MVRRLAVRLVAGLATVARAVAAVLDAWSRRWDGQGTPAAGGPPADWVERVRAKAPWLLEPPVEPLPPHDPRFEPRKLPPVPAPVAPAARRRGETERRIAEAGRRHDPVAPRVEKGGPERPGRASSIVPIVSKVRANLGTGIVAAKRTIAVVREMAGAASTRRPEEALEHGATPRRAPVPSRLGPPDVRTRAEHAPAPVARSNPAPVATIEDAPLRDRGVAAVPALAEVPRPAFAPETSWFEPPARERAGSGLATPAATFEVDASWPEIPPDAGAVPAPMPPAAEEQTAWPDLPAGLDDDDLVSLDLVHDLDRGAALDAELRSL